jgi:L-threonylcarbamoyladenylate synthase
MSLLLSNSVCEVAPITSHAIARAAVLLGQGALVAFPTETVYGLGADAENEAAVQTIYSTKGRPAHNPIIVHVADIAMAERYGLFTECALQLTEAFCEQGVTLVVPVRKNTVAPSVLAGGDTVALRCPKHPIAQLLVQAFKSGIAAPSANRSGRISPTSAAHVAEEFSHDAGALRLILDAGVCTVGVESTVVDCTGTTPRILRVGSVSAKKLGLNADENCEQSAQILRSPGLLASHYAPRARVRLNATHVLPDEALLAFGRNVPEGANCTRNLSASSNVEEAAFHLYDYLRQLDATGVATIAVMPIPHTGIGITINDRLQRAAAQRC